jgi:hypothetical protein
MSERGTGKARRYALPTYKTGKKHARSNAEAAEDQLQLGGPFWLLTVPTQPSST